MTKRCPWCTGTMIKDNGEVKCLACSREAIPPHVKHKQIMAFADLITADFIKFGSEETAKKWGISQRILYKLPGVKKARLTIFMETMSPTDVKAVVTEYLQNNGQLKPPGRSKSPHSSPEDTPALAVSKGGA